MRPGMTIMMSLPRVRWAAAWPSRKPSPAATMSMIDRMPQAIPNMVRKLRILLVDRARKVSPNNSRQGICEDTGKLDALFRTC